MQAEHGSVGGDEDCYASGGPGGGRVGTDDTGNVVSVNLDVKNPRGVVDLEHLPPAQLVAYVLDKE